MLKDSDKNLTGEDVREGLTAVISVRLRDAQFEGQTKGKLGNSEIKTLVSGIVTAKLSTYFEENPAVAGPLSTSPSPPAEPVRPLGRPGS